MSSSTTKRAYAWSHLEAKHVDRTRFVAVLEIPPVESAETAVRVQIVKDLKKSKVNCDLMKKEFIGTIFLGVCFFVCLLTELSNPHSIWLWIHLVGAIFCFGCAFVIWKAR
jgi:hypothetical protein